jgi:hypothetical protein
MVAAIAVQAVASRFLDQEKSGRMTHAITTTLAAALLALTTAGARAAELVESFAGDKPLGGLVQPGTEGAWTASLEGEAYTLSNASDAQAIKYLHLGALPGGTGHLGKAAVEVDVKVDGDSDPSGAGILYRFDPESRTYLLFALMDNGNYAIFLRTNEGIKRAAQGSVPGLKPESNRLSVRTEGEMIQFAINGQSGPKVKVGERGGGSVGIAAIGKGSFTFDNLAVREPG